MISKRHINLCKSLARKPQRDELGLFLAEGPRLIGELLPRFEPVLIWTTTPQTLPQTKAEVITVSPAELARLSHLTTPHQTIALFRRPEQPALLPISPTSFLLALDGVQDPGNVGTILRLADWFGVNSVVLSPTCADPYSPKVVQASMGAIAHLNFCQTSLPPFLQSLPADFPVWGTFLKGSNIYHATLRRCGVVLLGSEGNGISPQCEPFVTRRLLIPPFDAARPTCESLNVATAAAITLSEFSRPGSLAADSL